MNETTSSVCRTLHDAVEGRDLERMLSLYADNAELQVIDQDHPPSRPHMLHGKQAIAGYLGDIFSRDMTHHVVDEVIGEQRLSFAEQCEYPDGSRVFTSSMFELEGDRIVREVEVQAWDA